MDKEIVIEELQKRRKAMRQRMKAKIEEGRRQIGEKFPYADVTKAWMKQYMKVVKIQDDALEHFELKKVTNGYEGQQTEERNK